MEALLVYLTLTINVRYIVSSDGWWRGCSGSGAMVRPALGSYCAHWYGVMRGSWGVKRFRVVTFVVTVSRRRLATLG
jgi:hypothetical protein